MAWQDPHGQSEWRDAYGQYGHDPYSQQYGPEPQDTPPPGYGQNPYGQDPYSQNAYGQDPYGQYNYGAYPAVPPTQSGNPAITVAALVANIVSAVLCCGVGLAWIPGIILAAIAMGRTSSDPDSARKLTIGSWVCFGINVVLTVVGLVVIGLASDSHSTTNY